jgi:colicin import membrane protein
MVNVEMANAWLVNNARNANNLARNEAVRRSRAEAAEERAKAKAKKAAEAAKKEMNTARQAAVERSAALAAAERAARAASRGETSNRRNKTNAANKTAKKAAENAKKAQANALIQNIKKQWINVTTSNMSRNEKKKKGTTIYRKASVKLHPNKGGTNEDFRLLSNLFEKFKTYVNQN